MSLPVPLAVRVGNQHITSQVQGLSFRKEAVGGVRSITFNLARSLADLNGLDPLAKVYIYDTRSGATVADGRFSDPGRSADSNGQKWDCVAFGPAQAASDITSPKVWIDRGIGDGWSRAYVVHPEATMGNASKPDAGAASTQGILANFPAGITVGTNGSTLLRYERIWKTGGKLAYVGAAWQAGTNNTVWLVNLWTGADGAATTLQQGSGASTAGGVHQAGKATIPDDHNCPSLQFLWSGAPTTTTGDDNWCWWDQVVVEGLRYRKNGTAITSGYLGSTNASSIVEDLLGSGRLPAFDGTNAVVQSTATTFSQFSYPDGVSSEQVLSDLMLIEPAYRWTTGPDVTGLGYQFRWEQWPTTVRYEATLDDGGSFPLSTSGLYNVVGVRYIDVNGTANTIFVGGSCPILDSKGITRQAQIDLGSEVGSYSQALVAGQNFLAEHKVPKNAGTLNVARPIRDVIRGCDVMPWEIEAGELVRIRGVEAYPDAFNTSTNDGVGVFRIYALEYNSDGNQATLSLDSDPHTTEDALVLLMNERNRR